MNCEVLRKNYEVVYELQWTIHTSPRSFRAFGAEIGSKRPFCCQSGLDSSYITSQFRSKGASVHTSPASFASKHTSAPTFSEQFIHHFEDLKIRAGPDGHRAPTGIGARRGPPGPAKDGRGTPRAVKEWVGSAGLRARTLTRARVGRASPSKRARPCSLQILPCPDMSSGRRAERVSWALRPSDIWFLDLRAYGTDEVVRRAHAVAALLTCLELSENGELT